MVCVDSFCTTETKLDSLALRVPSVGADGALGERAPPPMVWKMDLDLPPEVSGGLGKLTYLWQRKLSGEGTKVFTGMPLWGAAA